MRFWFSVLLLSIIGFTVLLRPTLVNAQSNPLNLSISPITLVLETLPGQAQTVQLKLRNNASEAEKLKIRVGSFTADQTGSNPQLLEVDPYAEFLSWLKLSETEFVLGSNEWKTIQVTFSPPENAALSYYYSIYIERGYSPQSDPGETKVVGTAAVLVLTTVISPNAKQELQLQSVQVSKPWLEFLPVEINIQVKNSGNVHLAPTGNIFIDGQGKKDLAVLSINPNQNMILPGTTRNFSVVWEQGFPYWDSDQKSWDWDLSRASMFRFGHYNAHVVMVYDNGDRDIPTETSVSFWVLPWRLFLVGIAIPLLPAGLVFLIMKWKYRHA